MANTVRVNPVKFGYKIDGLRQLIRELEQRGIAVNDLKEAFREVGREGVKIEKRIAPVKTGDLRSTIRHTNAKNYAAILTGFARTAPYSRLVNYGSEVRGIRARLYGQKMSNELAPKSVRILERELNRIIVN